MFKIFLTNYFALSRAHLQKSPSTTLRSGRKVSIASISIRQLMIIETEPASRLNEDADYPISCMTSITGLSVIE